MRKTITLLAPALIAGQMRYPIEGAIQVREADADNLIKGKQAKAVGRAKTAPADTEDAADDEGNKPDNDASANQATKSVT